MATINIRDIDETVRARLNTKAGARGWNLGKLIEQYDALHDAARARADDGDDGLQAELQALGLETHSA